jgi:hypothetical protein
MISSRLPTSSSRHNSIVIFAIKILRYFRKPGPLTGKTTPPGALGGFPESKGDWMLKVLLGNFIIKVIKKRKCHS